MEFMLKLLQINTSVNTGSTGRIAEEIGSTAMKAGFGSYIAYGRMARESKSQLIHIGNVASVRRHALMSRLWDNHGFASTKATKLFVKELERINPDIIHLHNLHGYYLNVEVLFDYLEKVQKPILKIMPYQIKTAGIITTGSEVYKGRIKDTFTPVIVEKLKEYGVEVTYHSLSLDDHEMTTSKINEALKQGVDLVLCTGGMSVDPDDKTPLAIKNTGAKIISYGAPVLPGAMFLLSYKGDVPIVGLPGCVMYSRRTIFDVVLPRLLAKDLITSDELALLGEGGLCLNCPVCTFPNCGLSKG